MIFYNGAGGGLGRYFGEVASRTGVKTYAVKSRLEDHPGFNEELENQTKQVSGRAILVLFAAKVSVPWCESHAEETRKTNVDDTVASVRTFLKYCERTKISPLVISISSAHLYARNDGPIHETAPTLPRSVYAKSKLECENALRELADTLKFDLRVLRVFGLVAPAQPENYILHAMLKRAREKRLDGVPGLPNLRDYLDSRDVCRSILKVCEVDDETYSRVSPDRILNVASGKGQSIRSILELALGAYYSAEEATRLAGTITEAPPRADDVPNIIGSIERYRSLFGENPGNISISETIRDALVLS